MAIYTNEHLTDLLNEQYEKVRELEKENARLDEENHKLAYSLSQSVPVESSIEQYDRIKELEKEKEAITNFALDYQLWVKDFILSLDVKDDFCFMTFQGMRKQAYTHAKQSGRIPKWGDESYLDYQFGHLSGLEDAIKRLEKELQKSQKEIESLRAVYKKNIDSLSAGLSEDLLKTLRTYPTALPYICELKQELQATREQLDTVVKYLKISYQWGLYLYESEEYQEMEDEDEKENMKDDLDIVHSFLNKQKRRGE